MVKSANSQMKKMYQRARRRTCRTRVLRLGRLLQVPREAKQLVGPRPKEPHEELRKQMLQELERVVETDSTLRMNQIRDKSMRVARLSLEEMKEIRLQSTLRIWTH